MCLEERKCYLMVCMADYLMARWKKTVQEFIDFDTRFGILDFLISGYEPFHLTGEIGVSEEVEAFVIAQGGVL